MTKRSECITVCVTSYNHERFIATCIDSLFNQTHKDIEVFVIDDCSNDGSLDILRGYSDKIHLTIHEKNMGVPAYCDMVNSILKKATGKFFYRLDSDDFIEPDYFERMIAAYRQDNSLDWICGGLNVVDADGTITDTWDYSSWPTDPNKAIARGWQSCSVLMPHNGIIRTNFIHNNQLYWQHFPYGWGCDVEYTIRGMMCQPRIRLLQEPGFNWRTHGSNNSCDVARRINLVLAVKQYYLENIPHRLYLNHPALDSLEFGSGEYNAALNFLVAIDLFAARMNFSVPTMFETSSTQSEIDDNLYLFDDMIRDYSERSLAESPRYKADVNALLVKLNGQQQIIDGKRSLKLCDYRRAASQFDQALKTDETSQSALAGLSESYFGLGDTDRAEQFSARIIALNPTDSGAHNNLGVIHHSRGEFVKAEHSFTRALSETTDNHDAHHNSLELYASMSAEHLLDQRQRAKLLSSAQALTMSVETNERRDLLALNQRLRESSFAKHAGRYDGKQTRILLHQPENGALKYLMSGWAETLTIMGFTAELLSWTENMRDRFTQFEPSVFITVANPVFMNQLDLSFIKRYQAERKLQIGHVTTLEHRFDPVDFYITYHLDPSRDNCFAELDRQLLSLPFAIHPGQHQMRPGKEIWDYFFVGSNSYLKTDQTKSYLEPIVRNSSGILAGTGWEKGIGELSVSQASVLYNFAKIYPNYHLQEQFDRFNEVNERAFIIPACGGFQLVDNPRAMKEIFTEDEMAVADSPAEFHEMFNHFLRYPEQRLSYVEKGMKRVWRDYTLFEVLSRLAEFLGSPRQALENDTSHIKTVQLENADALSR